MPDILQLASEISQQHVVQACYDAMAGMEPDFEAQAALIQRTRMRSVTKLVRRLSRLVNITDPSVSSVTVPDPDVTTTCVEVLFAANCPRDDMHI
jgi:hypothetical protein